MSTVYFIKYCQATGPSSVRQRLPTYQQPIIQFNHTSTLPAAGDNKSGPCIVHFQLDPLNRPASCGRYHLHNQNEVEHTFYKTFRSTYLRRDIPFMAFTSFSFICFEKFNLASKYTPRCFVKGCLAIDIPPNESSG